jgi:hypothetical protein
VDLPPLDPDRGQLDAALAGLQVRWSMASDIAARGETPERIVAETLAWWRAAYDELRRRCWDPDRRPLHVRDGDQTETRPRRRQATHWPPP